MESVETLCFLPYKRLDIVDVTSDKDVSVDSITQHRGSSFHLFKLGQPP